MKIRPYNNTDINERSLYDFLNESLELAIDSYISGIPILQALEEKNNNIKKIFYILGKGKIEKSSKYEEEISFLEKVGMLKCNNNYCKATDEGISLYENYKKEEYIIKKYLGDLYKIGNIDMKIITYGGLESLLEYIKENGLPEPTGKYMDPFAEILFIKQPKNFTASILSTEYSLILLSIYKATLPCYINGRCTNYYITGGTILEELQKAGIDLQHFQSRPLVYRGLIEKLPFDRKRRKYKLTQLGRRVAEYIAKQAYIASNIGYKTY